MVLKYSISSTGREDGARRIRSSKSSLATCEFQGSLDYESLSQEAENGSQVGGWEEEEEEEDEEENKSEHPFPFLSHSTEQGPEDSSSCI